MTIDQSTHSLFGVSKASADPLAQECGRPFGLNTMMFRGGCLTGPGHAGTELHGFLAYLARCEATGRPYTAFGYGAKQVRDNIHSADLVDAFVPAIAQPRAGAVYDIGGGREVNCSMLEAIAVCERLTGRAFDWRYEDRNGVGDHKWWIGDISRFTRDYPAWRLRLGIEEILQEILEMNRERWVRAGT